MPKPPDDHYVVQGALRALSTLRLAEEEYGQWLEEMEEEFGAEAREEFEERNI